MRTGEGIRQVLTAALASILRDGKAAGWVVMQEKDKIGELREKFSDKLIALVSFDVDKIKDFVFTSTKPLEIQGASEIVKDLTREGDMNLPNCSVYKILSDEGLSSNNVLFAGGGTGLLIVPAEKVEKIAKEIRSRFASASQTGSVSVVWELFSPWELVVGPDVLPKKPSSLPSGVMIIHGNGTDVMPFGSLVQLLADRLREEKGGRLSAPIPPLPGYVRRCNSCGIRAAERKDLLREGEEPDWLCSCCFSHRNRGRIERKRLQDQELQTAESINDIVGEEERSYVALIYADANEMGQKLFKMPRMEDYAILSHTVTTVFDELRKEIVKSFRLMKRYQAPILGGDDLFFIVPAAKAAPIVSYLIEKTKERFGQEADVLQSKNETVATELRNVTLSVGFVIVPSHFNIRFSVDYIEALLRRAKEAYHDKGEECIDWIVVKDGSPLSLEVNELRETISTKRTRDWNLRLTSKPIRVENFNKMMKWMECLDSAKISRHQLKIIQDLLEKESPRSAKLNIRYQWLRIKEWKEKFFSNVIESEKWLEEFVLKELYPANYETGFFDLMELYEFREESV
jgi:CRISPR/Cas system-associated protein Cas10 (large subunit of type III CRISPR-Cas system)